MLINAQSTRRYLLAAKALYEIEDPETAPVFVKTLGQDTHESHRRKS